jgi:quercetin dioxygenase-like cupin family protein
MNSSTRRLLAIGILSTTCVLSSASARAQAATTEPQWFPVPTILPLGAKLAVVSGDPFNPGEFTIEFAMPDTYTLPPHTNPAREHVVIKNGSLRVGLGPKIDRKKSIVLAAGDTATTPAGIAHWSIAEGDTHIVVTYSTGPFGIAYMSKRDEPGSHSFPFSY